MKKAERYIKYRNYKDALTQAYAAQRLLSKKGREHPDYTIYDKDENETSKLNIDEFINGLVPAFRATDSKRSTSTGYSTVSRLPTHDPVVYQQPRSAKWVPFSSQSERKNPTGPSEGGMEWVPGVAGGCGAPA